MKGKLIIFEGIDCCGKTTQIDNLVEYYNSKNIKTISMSNVSSSPVGKAIRKVLSTPKYVVNNLQMAFLFISELYIVVEEIKKQLNKGVNVVLSRYIYSTLAYAGSKIEEFDLIEQSWVSDLKPDTIIYLDIDPKIALERLHSRENEVIEVYENIDKLSKVYDTYNKVWSMVSIKYPDIPLFRIDASKDIETVKNEIVFKTDMLF